MFSLHPVPLGRLVLQPQILADHRRLATRRASTADGKAVRASGQRDAEPQTRREVRAFTFAFAFCVSVSRCPLHAAFGGSSKRAERS